MTGLSSLRNFFIALIGVAALMVGFTTPALAVGLPGHKPEVSLMTTNGLTAAAPTPTPDLMKDQRLRNHSTELIGSAGDLMSMDRTLQLGGGIGLADDDPSFATAPLGLSDS